MRDASRLRRASLAISVAFLASAALLLWGPAAPPVAPLDVHRVRVAERMQSLPRLSSESSGDRSALSSVSSVASASTHARAALRVHGELIAEWPTPVAGLAVRVVTFDGEDAIVSECRSDADGRFVLDLDGDRGSSARWCKATVLDEDGARLFDGSAELDEHVVLLLRRSLTVRGRIVLRPRELVEDSVEVDVHAKAFPSSRTWVHAGGGSAEVDGRFSVDAYVDAPPESIQVAVTTGTLRATRVVDVAALLRSEDVEVAIDVARLDLHVVTLEGRPIAGATVSASAVDGSTIGEAVGVTCDGAGDASVLLEVGDYLIGVAQPGYRALLGERCTLELGERQARTVVLHPTPGDDATFRGTVAFADGRPAPNAFVAASPLAQGIAWSVARGAGRTAADGSFAIAVHSPLEHRVHAYLHGFGFSSTVDAFPPNDGLTLVLEAAGALEVDLDLALFDRVARGGPIDLLLVDRERETSYADLGWSLPTTVRELAPGSYNVYVYVPGLEAYGHATVDVAPGAQVRTTVTMAPAAWIAGRVVDAAGAPVSEGSVAVEVAAWSPEVQARWGTVRTDLDGRFRVMAGVELAPTLSIATSSGRAWSGKARAGEPSIVSLPANAP